MVEAKPIDSSPAQVMKLDSIDGFKLPHYREALPTPPSRFVKEVGLSNYDNDNPFDAFFDGNKPVSSNAVIPETSADRSHTNNNNSAEAVALFSPSSLLTSPPIPVNRTLQSLMNNDPAIPLPLESPSQLASLSQAVFAEASITPNTNQGESNLDPNHGLWLLATQTNHPTNRGHNIKLTQVPTRGSKQQLQINAPITFNKDSIQSDSVPSDSVAITTTVVSMDTPPPQPRVKATKRKAPAKAPSTTTTPRAKKAKKNNGGDPVTSSASLAETAAAITMVSSLSRQYSSELPFGTPPPTNGVTVKSEQSDEEAFRRANEHLSPEERRKIFLERNKVAASRCRQKRKQFMQELEGKQRELKGLNMELTAQLARLRAEADILREILLAHRDCSCTKVQAYVRAGSSKMHAAALMSMTAVTSAD